jgi:hypothetical protein
MIVQHLFPIPKENSIGKWKKIQVEWGLPKEK